MEERKYRIRPVNKVFIVWLLIILVLFASITVSFSYAVKKKSIMLQCEIIMQDVFNLYYEKVYSFSDVYIPIYTSENNEGVIRSYFNREGEKALNATERAKLVSLLGEMMKQDDAVLFIALYNPNVVHNYCFIVNRNSLDEFWQDIPIGNIENGNRMQLLGRYRWKDDGGNHKNAFLIRGGSQAENSDGCIIVGYNADVFEQTIRRNQPENLASFILANENGIIYDSEGIWYSEKQQTDWLNVKSTYYKDSDDKLWFIGSLKNNGFVFTAVYLMPWWKLFKDSNSITGIILLVLICFASFALLLYLYSTRKLFHKVEQIQNGLMIIGNNKLDYRLQVTNLSDEFDEIANNINVMTERLKDSVENEYQMRMRQTRSELRQIQARFNPHFLYNTLEVIRGDLFRNGDVENADYIEKLSRIFRKLTNSAFITSIFEEISFCSLYMALLQLRFHDTVDITYDIDANLQECGILAHLIQPAIENFFVHALSETTEYHAMDIICEPLTEKSVQFIIADNGTGLSQEHLEEINMQLHNPIKKSKGYGLASIANRIRLFYGVEYGVILEHNHPCGTRVIITIPRMSVEEHQHKLGGFE